MQKKKAGTQFFRNQLFLKIYERSRMGALVNTWSSIHFLQLNSKVILLLFCMLSLTGSGNHVYVLGGISRTDATFGGYDDVNDVFQLDWKDVERGWRKTTSMLFPRAFPLVFAAEGKIYVFEQLVFESFGEVYDISGDIWEPLSPPPEAIASNPVLDSSRSQILVHCHVNDSLYAYYYDRKSWVCLEQKFCYYDPPRSGTLFCLGNGECILGWVNHIDMSFEYIRFNMWCNERGGIHAAAEHQSAITVPYRSKDICDIFLF